VFEIAARDDADVLVFDLPTHSCHSSSIKIPLTELQKFDVNVYLKERCVAVIYSCGVGSCFTAR
jgi:hypothetical protein